MHLTLQDQWNILNMKTEHERKATKRGVSRRRNGVRFPNSTAAVKRVVGLLCKCTAIEET